MPQVVFRSVEVFVVYPSRDCWNFLQACMQGNFLKNLENSDCAQGKKLLKISMHLGTNPVSMSLRFEKSPCNL